MTAHTRKRLILTDPLRRNAHLTRFMGDGHLELTDAPSRKHIDAAMKGEALLAFACDHALRAFKRREQGEVLTTVLFLADHPELIAAGFVAYRRAQRTGDLTCLVTAGASGITRLANTSVACPAPNAARPIIRNLGGTLSGRGLFVDQGATITVGEDSHLDFGPDCRIGEGASITLEKGSTVRLGAACRLGEGSFVYLRSGAHLSVGDRCCFNQTSIDVFREISLGSGFLSARGAALRDGDGHDIHGLASPNYPEPVRIEEDVWVGTNALVLKGTSIGKGAIVAAGSVVTGNLPSRTLCAGVPARVIREGVGWDMDFANYRAFRDSAPTHHGTKLAF